MTPPSNAKRKKRLVEIFVAFRATAFRWFGPIRVVRDMKANAVVRGFTMTKIPAMVMSRYATVVLRNSRASIVSSFRRPFWGVLGLPASEEAAGIRPGWRLGGIFLTGPGR